jgi:hypothetical protein
MNCQFAEHESDRVRSEIDIAERRVGAGGSRRLDWVSQWAMRVFRFSRQQTLFMSFCVARDGCQVKILRRSSHRFSMTRNHPA